MTTTVKLQQSRKIELYPDQKKVKAELYERIREGFKRILVTAPCGMGKTRIAASIVYDAHYRSRGKALRVVFMVDLTVLLDQTSESFHDLGIEHTILQANRSVDWSKGVIIASAQTIASRLKKQAIHEILGDVDLFIGDEAHDLGWSRAWVEAEDYFLPRSGILIGLSATPYRSNNKQYLGQKFDTVVEALQPPELIKLGRLVRCRPFGVGGVFDLSRVDVRSGEYAEDQLEEQATQKAALSAVVREWLRLGDDRPTAAYCSGVEHAKQLVEVFLEQGVTAEWQNGATPNGVSGEQEHLEGIVTRKAQAYRLRHGVTKVICSVGTMTKGFDEKCIACVLFIRATMSKALFLQAAGRGGRVYEGKQDYILLDFGGNVQRHQCTPTSHQDWSIGAKPPRREQENERVTIKSCPECGFTEIPIFAKFCPECLFQFGQQEGDEPEEVFDEIELVEIFDKLSRQQAKYLRECKQHAYRENLSPHDAVQRFREEYGFVPPDCWHLNAVLGKQPSERKREDYRAYLLRHAPNQVNYRAWWRWETGEHLEVKQERRKRR